MTSVPSFTPLMKQYHDIKQVYHDALLLFQVGDFYELFFDDARTAAACLGIALTARGKNNGEPIPLCGVPVHALEHYVTKLVKSGHRVAICNQLEEATPGKVVERGVVQVLTPGTLTSEKLLDAKSASYLFSFFPCADAWGLLFSELMTAQLYATVLPPDMRPLLDAELMRFNPDEIVLPTTKLAQPFGSYFGAQGFYTSSQPFDSVHIQEDGGSAWVAQQFTRDLQRELTDKVPVHNALMNFYAYLKKNQQSALENFRQIHFYKPEDFLLLDAATQRNLELIRSLHTEGREHTLLDHVDRAVTPMGSRTLKKWLVRPLVKQEAIEQRLDVVQACVTTPELLQTLTQELRALGDLERVIGRIALSKASVNDYRNVAQALTRFPHIINIMSRTNAGVLWQLIANYLKGFDNLQGLLQNALSEDIDLEIIIKHGFDATLDELRSLVEHSNERLLAFERSEQERTGINSLKIRYNQIHGYSIEITKTHTNSVPADYIRQQTLVGKERYMTVALTTLATNILGARERSVQREQELFMHLKTEVMRYINPLRTMAHAVAQLDALLSFAHVATEFGYIRPQFTQSHDITITAGRHPVVAQRLGNKFIANDALLTETQSLWIITGPNMGGKSTFLRQIALISILGQCGSFVPAKRAILPILDRIFTRIGASDNVAHGKSTFLVEMEETALICAYATKNSLVILDEVGRGTSTFDGLAIAQAVVEYLYHTVQARCLFATHYHELTALENQLPGIVSYHAASKQTATGIVLLYKIMRGVADGSFGIEVAKMAQLPSEVVKRATVLVQELNAGHHTVQIQPAIVDAQQMPMNGSHQELVNSLRAIDYDNLSPKQALDLLWRLREQV